MVVLAFSLAGAQQEPAPAPAPAEEAHIRLSVDALFSVGASTLPTDNLRGLQGGGHDPKINGFNLQSVELSLIGAVDPYFSSEAHVLFGVDAQSGTSFLELEELFFRSDALPAGLAIKGGAFLTDFGRINGTHVHAWSWQDQPVILTRAFGPDGARGLGLELAWLVPVDWFTELKISAQNPMGETMVSFLGTEEVSQTRNQPYVDRDFNGLSDLAVLARLESGFDWTDRVSSKFGGSWMTGPNASGEGTFTNILGLDAVTKWKPLNARRGWPFASVEGELVLRRFAVDEFYDPGTIDGGFDDVVSTAGTLVDWGGYLQVMYGFIPRWAAGVRLEWATANEGLVGTREFDPLRDDRFRFSPLIAFHPSEFSRIRLQYNLDRGTHFEEGVAHTAWLGLEFMYGAHPAHEF